MSLFRRGFIVTHLSFYINLLLIHTFNIHIPKVICVVMVKPIYIIVQRVTSKKSTLVYIN
jgi:hypothetical protein